MRVRSERTSPSLFHKLLVGLLACCVISVAAVICLYFVRMGNFFSLKEGRRVEKQVIFAGELFEEHIDKYIALTQELAGSEEIRSALAGGFPKSNTELFSIIISSRRKWDITPAIHIVSTDGERSVSAGSVRLKYNSSDYSGLAYIIGNSDDIFFHANRFTNTEGELVVMTFAKRITDAGGELLGYIYLDLKEKDISSLFQEHPEIRIDGLGSAPSYMIFTKYNYCLYDEGIAGDMMKATERAFLSNEATAPFKEAPQKTIIYKLRGTDHVVSGFRTADGQFFITCFVPVAILVHSSTLYNILAFLMIVVIIAVCVVVALLINKSVIGPVKDIADTMTRYGSGEKDVRCTTEAPAEFTIVRDQLNLMIESINEGIRRNNEMQQLLLSEDNFLKAQIKPHFLNNVLETIRWMIELGNIREAQEALGTLGKMMTERMNYFSSKQERLADCLDFTKKYISIQKLCYPDKLSVEYRIDASLLDIYVPTFLLQPLAENAIVHGIQSKIGRGKMVIEIYKDEHINISVSDDGVGMPEELTGKLLAPDAQINGIALYNIHKRIQLAYGDSYGLSISSVLGEGTTITALLPPETGRNVKGNSGR